METEINLSKANAADNSQREELGIQEKTVYVVYPGAGEPWITEKPIVDAEDTTPLLWRLAEA